MDLELIHAAMDLLMTAIQQIGSPDRIIFLSAKLAATGDIAHYSILLRFG